MSKNFWLDLPKPFFALAPMESVTDVVFRHVISHAAKPDIFFTEFVNASSFCSPKGIHSTKGRLAFTSDEQPIVAQIWGKNPSEFETMAKEMAKMGFAGIDINMGCPDKAVVRTGSGSALIRTPELAAELITAAKKSGLPISVKTRIGDYKPEEWHNWLKFLLEQNIVNLTVHLRTRKEMSKVPAHYELIPEIIELRNKIAPQTSITINGDVSDRQQGIELAKKYKVDGIMIGRGVFTNPFAFEIDPKKHSRNELINLLKLQLDLHDKYSKELETRKFDPLKRFFKIYIRDFPGASELRDELMHTKNTQEARKLIENLGD
jgi:tRNA-dihydrouridine synthase